MSFSFLINTLLFEKIEYFYFICIVAIFSSFYVRNVYLKCHLRYVASSVVILLIHFLEFFMRSRGGMISISAFYERNTAVPYLGSNIEVFFVETKFYFVGCFVISTLLFFFSRLISFLIRLFKRLFKRVSFLKLTVVFLMPIFFLHKAECTTYSSPSPDPLYKTRYELEPEVVKDEIYVSRVILGNLFENNELKYLIRNSSDEPFYTLDKLQNGFNWKEMAMQGYLFDAWLKPNELFFFWPSSGGWTKYKGRRDQKGEKVMNHSIRGLDHRYIEGGWPDDARGETVVTYNIPVLKDSKIQEVVLKFKFYRKEDRTHDTLNYWFEKNPIDSLKIVSPSSDAVDDWYFQISEEDDEGVIFLLKYQKDKEIFKDIPKEYYPNERLVNNDVLNYWCALKPACKMNLKSPVLTFYRSSFEGEIPDAPTMPDELKIPPPEEFEVLCLYKGELCNIKGTRYWMKNDEFVPLDMKSSELMSCSGLSCAKAYNKQDRESAMKENAGIDLKQLEAVLKWGISYSTLFLNLLFFFGLKVKNVYGSGYFNAFESSLFFSVVDYVLLSLGGKYIIASYGLLYPFGAVVVSALLWAFVRFMMLQFIKNKIKLKQRSLFFVNLFACLAVAWIYFWTYAP